MRLSIVIPSYKQEKKLVETIQSFVHSAKSIFELLVILDDESSTAIASLLQNKFKDKINIRIHVQKNAGRAAARNKGAELTNGELLLFLDDDMICEENFIDKHLDFHLKNKNCILFGSGFLNPAWAKNDFHRYQLQVENTWIKVMPEKEWISFENFAFTACNLSLSKSLFNSLNGFDTRLRDAEDFDFAIRALQKKNQLFYDRTVIAWHNDFSPILKYIARHNQYLKAKMELLEIHPVYISHFPNLLPQKNNFFKKIILKILKKTICPIAIKQGGLFSKLPMHFKFSLFRLTISAYSDSNA